MIDVWFSEPQTVVPTAVETSNGVQFTWDPIPAYSIDVELYARDMTLRHSPLSINEVAGFVIYWAPVDSARAEEIRKGPGPKYRP